MRFLEENNIGDGEEAINVVENDAMSSCRSRRAGPRVGGEGVGVVSGA